ncbi:PQQ-dependent sugar dehydrogenase [Catellatospora sp. KI3]|uniref:PQQ-dependent sugar dehydrogenase n=1 Tax=Catellatospora sp. KI3 TaxID=3041620 RepID=UPI002482357C|nr:PQQ-dependent sugar dehydrogenase [Catellatospora sp. KI3]MDI1462022.1 PQQ-dependent sugar dehydrogenase [Catellatospora sp. KI3]
MRVHRRLTTVVIGLLTSGLALAPPAAAQPRAQTALAPQTGFVDQVAVSGLSQPMNLEFAKDGRLFVAEKRGVIKVYDSVTDTSPTVFADLTANVHHQWDRGLLGMALAPDFPADPWVYVLYTYDAPPGKKAPFWHDVCAQPTDGTCLATSRVSRLKAAGNRMTGAEEVLVSGWCQQFPSHSVGDLKFGRDGMLYATAGDGANFSKVDYGQLGTPANPCGDPAREGGALRAQDPRTSADPAAYNGALLRLDPRTGKGAPDNPNAGAADEAARRVVAYGLRNPFRFNVRPGTDEVWISDVGWNGYEEVDRLKSPKDALVNFGWPCYEGPDRMRSYDNADLPLCESLYTAGGAVTPYFSYGHTQAVAAGDGCGTAAGSAVGPSLFYPREDGAWPDQYAGSLLFTDYVRNCVWAMLADDDGVPDPEHVSVLARDTITLTDLALGPDGDVYYTSRAGSVHRLRHAGGNGAPTAYFTATPASGPVPLTVEFDAAASTDPDVRDLAELTYQWDFTSDGSWDDTGRSVEHTYPQPGRFAAKLRVTDALGAFGEYSTTIRAGGSAPVPVIEWPTTSRLWRVGEKTTFQGHADDPEQGRLPAAKLAWQLRLQHCADGGGCHTHVVSDFTGVAKGSFTGPEHEFPSYLELALTATDADGLSGTVLHRLDPKTVKLTFKTEPSGLELTVGSYTAETPFTRELIQGASTTVTAGSPQDDDGDTYVWKSWSDKGRATHVVKAPPNGRTFTAVFAEEEGR